MAVIEITAEMTSAEQRAAQNTNNANLDNTKLDKSGGTVTGDLEVTGAFDVGSFSDVANIKTKLGIGKQIWSGSWSSGDITVPEINNYTICQLKMEGMGTSILAIRTGNHLRGIGGYSSGAPTVQTYHFAATVDGTTLTFIACNAVTHSDSSSHSTINARTVTSIIGLI